MNTWADYIAAALTILGGESELAEIYKTVGILRVAQGKPLPENFRAVVRHQMQRHRMFEPVQRGRWRLRRLRVAA